MATTNTAAATFGARLRVELDRQEMGVRTLARRMAGTTETRAIETARRRLNKYLRGATPSAAKRHEIEEHLGLDRDALADPDDEEAHQRMRNLDFLFGDLFDRIETFVDAKLAAREAAA